MFAWVLILTFVSEVLGTISGLGSSPFFLPFADMLLDAQTALGFVAFLHVFSNIGKLTWFWKDANYKLAITFGIPNLIGAGLGAFLVVYVAHFYLQLGIGLLIAAVALLELIYDDIRLPRNLPIALGGGFVAGFLSGLLGTGGTIRSLFLVGFGVEKKAFVGTSGVIDFAGDALRLGIYLSYGFLPRDMYFYLPFIFVLSLGGAYLGKQLLDKVANQLFRKILIYSLLVISAVFLFNVFRTR